MPRKALTERVRISSLSELDGRTAAAREARALASAIESDIGGDPTAAQRVLIEQGACLAALCSDYAKRHLCGDLKPEEIPGWLASVNNLRRVLETIGLERRAHRRGRRECNDRYPESKTQRRR